MSALPTDLEISRQAALRPIPDLAAELGIPTRHLMPHGPHKAKVHLDVLPDLTDRPLGKYVDITAITPTPLGEGKTTTAVGLTQGLGAVGKRAIVCLRQPSLGPTFGIKGGAAGGGYSQVVPMEDLNLHLTGDVHAISVAHNLIAAALDARLYHEERFTDYHLAELGLRRLDIDPHRVAWRRVVDVNDRALRSIVIGLGEASDGVPRQSGYDIAVASELMAILALVDGDDYGTALADLRRRCGRIILAAAGDGRPVTAEDLGVAGAAAVLMKDTLHPNLLQTLEGQAAFIHAGPFGNIAHGNSSILADRLALRLGEYVVTESGFGADTGMEKFFDIKCRVSGLVPDCVVLVATVRALKMHGGGPAVKPGRPLDAAYTEENLELLQAGLDNLVAHIDTAELFGVPVVVAVNRFGHDTDAEVELVTRTAREAGAMAAVASDHFRRGGEGARELAEAVVAACEEPTEFRFLYPPEADLKEKIETIATRIYRAGEVEYTPAAERLLRLFANYGLSGMPVCMAKTHLSISHDPTLLGAPSGYVAPVRELRASAGAGFVTAYLGDIRTMPGLGSTPAYLNVDLDEAGQVTGLF